MKNIQSILRKGVLCASLGFMPFAAFAGELKPFVMGSSAASSIADASAKATAALQKNGFEVVGSYAPDADSNVIVVTNDALKKMAGASKNGGFGAMERVAVVKNGSSVEVSYTNPEYMWNAYRMQGDIKPVQAAMQAALGAGKTYGAAEGLSPDDLRDYHYKIMMPYFDDVDELAEFGSHQAAVDSVEAGLKANRAGAKKVYRINVSKDMTVFGVALKHGEGDDAFIRKSIDGSGPSHAAHFPYEILVVGNEVVALNAKFRIAINWPSLSMMGSGSFMSIMSAPDDITASLTAVANNKKVETTVAGEF
ncbi:hypothetical protein [Thiomicrorhabdus sp.]|uniref:hypothetical protein n=1 Tax=Thiomicrorhabdus sp. TaxID=2039724 RepID=UPI0029C9A388|nr:hypothetical protein [Thiomicrorhabdus sp.]